SAERDGRRARHDLCHGPRSRRGCHPCGFVLFSALQAIAARRAIPENAMRLAPLLLALAFALPACALHAQTRIPDEAVEKAGQLREQALASDLGWQITESLTTEVGPRLAGTEADARAVAWAKAKFEELGYDKVWTEPVTFPKWERRSESAEV